MIRTFASVVLVACVFGVAGCGSDDSSSSSSSSSGGASSSSSSSSSSSGGTAPSTQTTYKGTFAGAGGDGGAIQVTVGGGGASKQTIHPLAVQQVSGTLTLSGGGSVTITGSFDDQTNQLTITGGGYSFTGTATSDGVTGTYTGPKGSGTFTVFASANAVPYCGTFTGDSSGVWNFVVDAGKLSGSAVGSDGKGDLITGTVTGGTDITFTTKNNASGTGKISGSSATGDWASAGGGKGTWSGTAGCGG